MAKKRIALVTGANKGIGYEIARQLGEKGYHVLVGARKAEAGKQAVASLQKGRASAEFVEIDVSDRASIQQAAKAVAAQFDHLDALINNAAIMEDKGNITEVPDELLLRTLKTNTLGPLHMTQAFLPLLTKSSGATVVNVSSGLGQLTDMADMHPAYSISKTSLNAVTRQFAAALRDKGVTVNSVCPGWVKTDMGGANAPRTVQQGADTVTWLATEAPRDLTGQFLRDRNVIPW
ncbi:MAG TPA: SDR family oxidoreductase [Verrucomicrobiae bacterium]|nr:SDR family oxidoreductase [Verrucomicrobiae bacterium]